ncbi:MAG: flagellar basal body P-ring formation chaperone FlgA [Hyphomicrobiaceae bacterium]
MLGAASRAIGIAVLSTSVGVSASRPAQCAQSLSSQEKIEVVVPQVAIYPGDEINAGLLTTKVLRSSARIRNAVFTSKEQLGGLVARRTLVPGQPISRDAVRASFVVKQGQPVSIRYLSGSISIVLTGAAIQSGSIGDVISVRNSDTGRIVRARITNAHTLSLVGP